MRHTLGLLEVALLGTEPQGLVEEAVEHGVGGGGQVVVRLDVLLERLAAGSIAVLELQNEKTRQ